MNAALKTEKPDAMERVRLAVAAAESRKAEDLRVLNLAEISSFTDRFVICSGTNERQVQAIADAILRGLRKQGVKPLNVEGLRHGRWVLLDYGGDMIVHVFLDETREVYALERLWSDATVETDRFSTAE